MGRHAFLIMAHDDFDLLGSLLRALDHARADIFIHIDKASKDVPWAALSADVKAARLAFIPSRRVHWAGFSQVDVELRLLEAALALEERPSYLHLLSGHDLPIVSADELYSFFDERQGLEFVDCWARLADGPDVILENGLRTEHYLRRLRTYQPMELRSREALLPRAMRSAWEKIQLGVGVDRLRNADLPFCYGSNWFSITSDLAHYVLGKRALINHYFRHTRGPDELFLQTVVLDSPFQSHLYQENHDGVASWNARSIDWSRPGVHRYSPYVWREEDVERLSRSGDIFARKFDSRVDAGAIRAVLTKTGVGDPGT